MSIPLLLCPPIAVLFISLSREHSMLEATPATANIRPVCVASGAYASKNAPLPATPTAHSVVRPRSLAILPSPCPSRFSCKAMAVEVAARQRSSNRESLDSAAATSTPATTARGAAAIVDGASDRGLQIPYKSRPPVKRKPFGEEGKKKLLRKI